MKTTKTFTIFTPLAACFALPVERGMLVEITAFWQGGLAGTGIVSLGTAGPTRTALLGGTGTLYSDLLVINGLSNAGTIQSHHRIPLKKDSCFVVSGVFDSVAFTVEEDS